MITFGDGFLDFYLLSFHRLKYDLHAIFIIAYLPIDFILSFLIQILKALQFEGLYHRVCIGSDFLEVYFVNRTYVPVKYLLFVSYVLV